MKTISRANTEIIARAAAEAGIRADERYNVSMISREGNLIGFVIETEWSRTTCYADDATGEVLGVMTEAKELAELMSEARTSVNARPVRRTAAGRAA